MPCIIFDLDGTLIDSEPACNQALLDLLPELDDGLDQMVERNRGRRLAHILSDMEARLSHPLSENFESIYRQRVAALFDDYLEPMPGAEEVLQALTHPVCVASSGPRAKIGHALKRTGLARFFDDRIFSSYDVGVWKPDPGLFLHAANAMGVTPADCAVVEDSPVGVAAALAAEMRAFHFMPSADPNSH